MEETELDEYNLNFNSKNQSLKISIINNYKILMILINLDTNQEYSSLISLEDLKSVSNAFNSAESIQNALNILKSAIESGNILLAFYPNNESIGIKFSIILDSINYEPFDIILYLQENENENEKENENENSGEGEGEVEELPATFDYQGDKELEKRYGKITKGTTEYIKPILEPDVKPPILHLKYIEPILQVHYPDGTTQSKALPPRIENINGETPNISEEEFRKIQEEMDKNTNSVIKDFEPINNNNYHNNNSFQRSNSVAVKNNSIYNSISTLNNENKNDIINNPLLNSVRPAMESNSSYSEIYNRRSSFNPNRTNNNLNENFYDYSNMTHHYYNSNTLNTNYLKNSNYSSKTENINFSNIIERRPRMINTNTNGNQRNIERSPTNPSQNIQNFNSNQNQVKNIYQPNPTSNIFQTNEFLSQNEFNNNVRFPFDRNTERTMFTNNNQNILNQEDIKINNYQSLTMRHPQQDNNLLNNINNLLTIKPNISIEEQQSQIQDTLNLLQKQQQKLQEVQLKLSQIKQQQMKFHNTQKRQLREQIQIQPNQNINSENNNFSQSLNPQFKKQASRTLKREISQEQINFARMASIQNEEDPNVSNMKAIILPDINEESPINKEIQNTVIQREVLYEDINNEEEENSNVQKEEENQIYEELFRTDDGKIIFRNGLLRGIIHKYYEIDDVVSKIQDISSKGVKFHLAYKAFDLDDKAETFHQKCDNLNMSLVLIETDQDVRFGGFTTKTWKGDCLKKIDNSAFVFNLNNKKIYDIVTNQPAIGSYPKFGPVFFGCQIRIYDEFFKNGGTTCKKGLNYKTTNDYELNNGKQKYLVKDIEVYRLELIDID